MPLTSEEWATLRDALGAATAFYRQTIAEAERKINSERSGPRTRDAFRGIARSTEARVEKVYALFVKLFSKEDLLE